MITATLHVSCWLKSLEQAERSLYQVVRRFFVDQAERIAREVQQSGPVLSFIFNAHDELGVFIDEVFPQLARTMAVAWRMGKRKDFEWMEPSEEDIAAVVDWELPEGVLGAIQREISELAEQPYWLQIQKRTERNVAGILEDAIREGQSTYQIGMQIRDDLPDNKRAQRIARTEVTGAMNAGQCLQIDEAEALGLRTLKTWWTVEDDLRRDEHADAHGQTVSGRDEFTVGGYRTPYPGHWSLPVEHRANCRCGVLVDLEELREIGL